MKTKSLLTSIILLFFAGCIGAYAEETTSPKHHIELSISDGTSIIRNGLQTGEVSALQYETLSYMQNGELKGGNLNLFPINAGYYYQALPWLQVGGEFSAFTNSLINASNSLSSINYTNTSLYLTAGLRFTYYQTNFVQLYSGLSLGVRMNVESQKSTLPYPSVAPSVGDVGIAFQATAFGVRFGKQVYGFAELGCGYKGIFNLGIGTRF